MDLIAVIDAGRLVELGTHRELIRNRGEYSSMYDVQLRKYGLNRGFEEDMI